MKVPLIVNASRKSFKVIYQKRVEEVEPPFNPYMLITKEKLDEYDFTMTNFSDRKILQCKKIPIPEETQLGDMIYDLRTKGYGVEYNRYLDQIIIDDPAFLLQFPNGEPDTLCFDIEIFTDGSGIFPHWERSPILSIAAKYNNEPPVIFTNFREKSKYPDALIIKSFLELLRDTNPDIIVTYNGKGFDIPYLVQRAMKAGIDLKKYSRLRKEWAWHGQYDIPGHIQYDIYKVDAAKDQSLMGIKNRKLKTLAKWFGIPFLELEKHELSNTGKVDKDKLIEYNASDVEVSYKLYQIYHRNHETMAELLTVPLDQAINTYPSFPPKIVLGRAMKALNFVFIDNNEARHPGLTGKYEGGYVEILKKGLIPKVWKLDVAGFYPSVMITFNISPETTKIEDVSDYTGEWSYYTMNNKFYLTIPDKKLNKDILLSIDQQTRGVLSTMLEDMRGTRLELKKQAKSAETKEEQGIFKARSDALKVMMNSVYGSAALPETVYSDLGVALATISICRFIFKQVVDKYRDHVIEADSVVGDTPLLIRVKGGKFHSLVTISSLMDVAGEIEVDENGCVRKIPSIPLEVLSNGKFVDLEYIYEHMVNKPIYRVASKEFLCEVTEDHSLIDANGQQVKPEDVETVKICRPLPEELPSKEDVVSVDYAELLGMVARKWNGDSKKWKDFLVSEPKIEVAVQRMHMNTHSPIVPDKLRRLLFDSRGIKRVPQAMLEAPVATAAAFLRGYGQPECESKLLAAGIMLLLKKAGSHPRVSESKTAGLNYLVTGGNLFKREQKIESVEIYDSGTATKVYDVTTSTGTFTNALGFNELKNTDGIYVDKPLDTEDVKQFIKGIVESMIGPTTKDIEIEKEVFGPGWFHRSKNYVLYDSDRGEPIFHGVAFKASSHSPIYDNIMNVVAQMIFAGSSKDEIWSRVEPMLDLSKYKLSDFVLRTSIKGSEEQYANENSLQVRLIQQAKKIGISVEQGTQIEYIVTKGKQYIIASQVESANEIDTEYYKRDIMKALDIFGLESIQQLDLQL